MIYFMFWDLNNISGTAEARIVKFGTQVDYIKFCLKITKPLTRRSRGHDLFLISTPAIIISGTANARVAKILYTGIEYIKYQYWDDKLPPYGRGED